MWLMVCLGFRGWWLQYLAMALCTPFLGPMPSLARSRKIPNHIRRAVLQEHIKRTGRFDSNAEEIDHIVPFIKGGGHTKDNLWVVPRTLNRAKGSKMPALEDWLRFTLRRYRRPPSGRDI
jgi:5-methylcytosine-specific restriction endonuclease McrA